MGMTSIRGEIVQVQGGHIVLSTGCKDSKAVDWLIKKAKFAIDNLAELPPWHPPGTSNAIREQPDPDAGTIEMTIAKQSVSFGYNFQLYRKLAENPYDNSTFIPPSLDSEAITDTLKSLFSTSSATSFINFQSYPPEIVSRASNPTQDLGLSLNSFQDHSAPNGQTLFAESASVLPEREGRSCNMIWDGGEGRVLPSCRVGLRREREGLAT
ncbi:transcription factor TCP4-like [Juglans microcarpa x Juglans regia]|uniref:transcription factor TCP4-like n=1 Tax=Juglans microcarpa x Juglans regia TaxID=2249226 RepID=UPI001B7EA39E|nr:transcription factor TCP4-like [Juglans microcarpa x Juglans regia]